MRPNCTKKKRCEELERKARFFVAEIEKFNVPLASAGSPKSFLDQTAPKSAGALLSQLEAELEDAEHQVSKSLLSFTTFHCARCLTPHLTLSVFLWDSSWS